MVLNSFLKKFNELIELINSLHLLLSKHNDQGPEFEKFTEKIIAKSLTEAKKTGTKNFSQTLKNQFNLIQPVRVWLNILQSLKKKMIVLGFLLQQLWQSVKALSTFNL